jgi:hypothetical protein
MVEPEKLSQHLKVQVLSRWTLLNLADLATGAVMQGGGRPVAG